MENLGDEQIERDISSEVIREAHSTDNCYISNDRGYHSNNDKEVTSDLNELHQICNGLQ